MVSLGFLLLIGSLSVYHFCRDLYYARLGRTEINNNQWHFDNAHPKIDERVTQIGATGLCLVTYGVFWPVALVVGVSWGLLRLLK